MPCGHWENVNGLTPLIAVSSKKVLEASDGECKAGKGSTQEYQEGECRGAAEADDCAFAEVRQDGVGETGREGGATEAIQGRVGSSDSSETRCSLGDCAPTS